MKAVIISSLVFGLVHLFNISSFASIPYVLLQAGYSMYFGFILGLMYAVSDNILLPIAMHMSFNIVNGDLAGLLYDIEYNALYFIVNISIGVILGIYYLIICLLYYERMKIRDVSGDMDF